MINADWYEMLFDALTQAFRVLGGAPLWRQEGAISNRLMSQQGKLF